MARTDKEITITQLVAVGSSVESLDLTNASAGADVEIEVIVATVGTSVTLRAEYSNDDFTSSIYGASETFTADGTYVLPSGKGYKAVRLELVAEVGGTVTVDGTLKTIY